MEPVKHCNALPVWLCPRDAAFGSPVTKKHAPFCRPNDTGLRHRKIFFFFVKPIDADHALYIRIKKQKGKCIMKMRKLLTLVLTLGLILTLFLPA